MPSSLSQLDICNGALDLLEEAPIEDIDEDRSVARWFKRNFWMTAHELMRLHPWNFAMARASIGAAATAPAFGWTYAYEMPADCLRVVLQTIDGTQNGTAAPFQVEGGQILTDQAPPFPLRYIRRVDNTGLFDNQFSAALTACLASKAAHYVTGKASYADRMNQLYQSLILNAQMIDSLEGTPDEPDDGDWITARQ